MTFTKQNRPLGPGFFEVMTNLWAILSDPIPFWSKWQDKYGDCFRINFGKEKVWLVSHPDLVRKVFLSEASKFDRDGPNLDALSLFLGDGLLTSPFETWKKQRRLMQPVFSQKNVMSFLPIVQRVVDDILDTWLQEKSENEVSLQAFTEGGRIAIGVLGHTLASEDILPRLGVIQDSMEVMNEQISWRIKGLPHLPDWVPTSNLSLIHI